VCLTKSPPHENSIRRWDKQLKDTGIPVEKQRSGRSSVSDESVENVRNSFIRSPKKSVRKCALELGLSKTTIHRVLNKRLRFTGYKLQLLHAIRSGDNRKRCDFAVDILYEIDKDEQFLHRVMFSDEPLHVSGHVHRHNVRIWANERPHVFAEHERDSPKDRVIGPCFSAERTVTSHNYLDMLELFAVPLSDDDNVIIQHDGSPAHYANIVTEFLY
jgi:transposase